MSKVNTPVDHMFRAGQISGKQWARLSMKQPAKKTVQKSKMANFDEKTKNEGGLHNKAVSATRSNQINGPHQGVGTPAHAGGLPSRGGQVRNGGQPKVSQINQGEMQKPNFPAGAGSSSKNAPGKSYSAQQPSSSHPSGGEYGGPSSRPGRPSRLG